MMSIVIVSPALTVIAFGNSISSPFLTLDRLSLFLSYYLRIEKEYLIELKLNK